MLDVPLEKCSIPKIYFEQGPVLMIHGLEQAVHIELSVYCNFFKMRDLALKHFGHYEGRLKSAG